MGSYSIKRFAQAHILTSMQPPNLRAFLSPYGGYLAGRGFDVSRIGIGFSVDDAEQLLGVLMHPDANTPQRLIEALYHVNEMATPDGMDLLVTEFGHAGYVLSCPHPTTADIAVLAWNTDPNLVEQVCARHQHTSTRVCRVYLGKETSREVRPLTGGQIVAIESAMNDWFEAHMLGRHCHVFPFTGGAEHCYVVRRGQPYARVSAIDNGRSSSLLFQPEVFDIVVYDAVMRQLRISSASNAVRDEYIRLFGEHMFGDAGYFGCSSFLTMLPLVRKGPASLCCTDIPGLLDVKLRKVKAALGGAEKGLVTWEGADVFANSEFREKVTSDSQIAKASLAVTFEGAPRARCVELEPPNILRFHRDGDLRPVGTFLALRGFIRGMEQ